jgi:hypothetical protein
MVFRARWVCAGLLLVGFGGGSVWTQVATGDARTVVEPVFPATVCKQVAADLTVVGGEPSSELNTATDTAAIQGAFSGCAAGSAVEVVMGSGGQNAMVIAPIAIPGGMTLLVDGGVTLFGSRVAADYQIGTASSGNTCGTTDGGSACNPLITLGETTVNGKSSYSGAATTGLMGYGVINGRGGDKLGTISGGVFTPGTQSWWDLALSGTEDNPILLSMYKTVNAQLYKITLLNSPHFHIKLQGSSGSSTAFTVWGLKLLTPWTAKNTDGIDPTAVMNMTVKNSLIGDGDDESAISGSSATSNFTYDNLLLSSGHGLSIGSITTSAVTNVLVNNANFNLPVADGNEIALRIKSYCGSGGGLVSKVTYQNVCIQGATAAIELDPYYTSTSGTSSCPLFASGTGTAPITYQNIYITTPASYINLQGYNAAADVANVVLNNVYVNGSSLALSKIQSSDTAPTPSYANITLNGSYFPTGWASLGGSNSVTETVNGTTAASFDTTVCANKFPALLGEVFASTTTGGVTKNNINTSATVTIPATVTLQAMVMPTTSEATYSSYTGSPAPTAGVNFYDGTTLVGTGSLGANGTLASATITNPTAGVHTYTAQYAGDGNYAATTLGANPTGSEAQQVQITVNAGPGAQLAFTTAPSANLTYGSSVGTVAVTVQDAAGDAVTGSSAPVTLTVTGPGSYTAMYTANASSGVATFSSVANLPMVGSYSYAATSAGLTGATANQTVGTAQLQASAAAASRIFGQPNPNFVYSVSGYVNGDGSGVVSGMPVLSTAAVRNSPAGQYPIVETQGSLSATNYVFLETGNTLTVNGGAVQVVNFYPLPSFPNGGSYQLSATASSGLPVTYSVSGNGASVAGSVLTLTSAAAGQTITVTASQAGNASYAAATSVMQSFVAR